MRRLPCTLLSRRLASSATSIPGDIFGTALAHIEKANERERIANERRLEEREREASEREREASERERTLLQTELLKVKGLMTSRGVVEICLRRIHEQAGLKGTFNATTTILKVLEKEDASQEAQRFLKCVRACDVPENEIQQALRDLYARLSDGIHGAPFYGESVKVFSNHLTPVQACIVKQLVQRENLVYVEE
jgi:hypothetical protein